MDDSSKKKSILANVGVCVVPLILFIIVELMYDKKYFMGNFMKASSTKNMSMIVQYTTMIIIALIVCLYNLYTINKDDELLETERKEESNDSNKDVLTSKSLNVSKNVVLFGILTFMVVLVGSILYARFTNNKIKGIVFFFIYSVICLCNMSFTYERVRMFKNTLNLGGLVFSSSEINEMPIKLSLMDFLGKGLGKMKGKGNGTTVKDKEITGYVKASMSTILPGLVFGVVFGFIDNAGLISGLDALDTPFGWIAQFMVGGNPLSGGKPSPAVASMLEGTTSGLGNLFSDGLGVSIGAFFGKIASTIFPSEVEQPIWVDMVGISLGCILGIAIPLSVKNLTNGNMWANGLTSFRFIKDLVILSLLLVVFVMVVLYIPKRAKAELEKAGSD